ncbi:hypothetical protein KDY119_02294 [Luteimicrobium xylanilyticum]|uniref:Uncharacterized protein n=1 Tax=Luteimicrobium xylanilyticum TaxID=1133546 RepID=A0A5P9QE82_9MICO|nr:hypothetical protein KDY119_02294 [Luteimicrobium xylanilyticum]
MRHPTRSRCFRRGRATPQEASSSAGPASSALRRGGTSALTRRGPSTAAPPRQPPAVRTFCDELAQQRARRDGESDPDGGDAREQPAEVPDRRPGQCHVRGEAGEQGHRRGHEDDQSRHLKPPRPEVGAEAEDQRPQPRGPRPADAVLVAQRRHRGAHPAEHPDHRQEPPGPAALDGEADGGGHATRRDERHVGEVGQPGHRPEAHAEQPAQHQPAAHPGEDARGREQDVEQPGDRRELEAREGVLDRPQQAEPGEQHDDVGRDDEGRRHGQRQCRRGHCEEGRTQPTRRLDVEARDAEGPEPRAQPRDRHGGEQRDHHDEHVPAEPGRDADPCQARPQHGAGVPVGAARAARRRQRPFSPGQVELAGEHRGDEPRHGRQLGEVHRPTRDLATQHQRRVVRTLRLDHDERAVRDVRVDIAQPEPPADRADGRVHVGRPGTVGEERLADVGGEPQDPRAVRHRSAHHAGRPAVSRWSPRRPVGTHGRTDCGIEAPGDGDTPNVPPCISRPGRARSGRSCSARLRDRGRARRPRS